MERGKEAGIITVVDPGSDKSLFEEGTRQCVHCGFHWTATRGSGEIRGYCMNCKGPICGPKCLECVPAEQQIENMEQGRPLNYKPVKSSVTKLWMPGDK